MALIVEDGTGIPNANSYGTIVGARAYATDRGVTLLADDVVTAQLINATDFLESFDYVGKPVVYSQSLSWPRVQVFIDPDTPFPSNQLPVDLVRACYQCVIEQFNGVELQPTTDISGGGGFVTEEKVDVLTTKFSEKIFTTTAPLVPKVMSLLRGLLVVQQTLRTVRV